MSLHRWSAFVCAMTLLALIGCGKDDGATVDGESQPDNSSGPQPIVVTDDKHNTATPDQPTPRPSANGRHTDQKPEVIDEELAESGEQFSILGDGPRFEVVGDTQNDLAVRFPDFGVDSTSYFVVDKPKQFRTRVTDAIQNVELPKGFIPIPEFGVAPNGLPNRILCEKDESPMALVPAGISLLGIEGRAAVASPKITVEIDYNFYIDVYEVTVGRYNALRELRNKALPKLSNSSADENFPALGVSHSRARAYLGWADKKLPTEAEWEKAARGMTGYEHPWGNGRAIWPELRNRHEISPIGSYPNDESPYGALDMAGNAREWCEDYFSTDGHQSAKSLGRSPVVNWTGAKVAKPSDHYVVKGGGPHWEAWYREGVNKDERLDDIGFRGVLRLKTRDDADDDDF